MPSTLVARPSILLLSTLDLQYFLTGVFPSKKALDHLEQASFPQAAG